MQESQDSVWSTEGLSSALKMRRWTETVSEHMTEMVVESDDPASYSAHWRKYTLGAVDLNFIDSGMQRCIRSARMIRRGGPSTYELVYLRSGGMVVTTGTGVEHVPAGSFTLLRNEEPYQFRCLMPTDALTVHLDDAWLGRWLTHHENFTRTTHAMRRAWGAPLAALLNTISQEGLDHTILRRSTIADQIGALFALMSQPERGASRSNTTALVTRIRASMRERLGEADLSPGDLAKECGISLRYLHMLFARLGTTFGQELMGLRLNRARELLRDPRYLNWPIAWVAAECGFSEQSHFTRRFRRRFGLTPRAVRSGPDDPAP